MEVVSQRALVAVVRYDLFSKHSLYWDEEWKWFRLMDVWRSKRRWLRSLIYEEFSEHVELVVCHNHRLFLWLDEYDELWISV